MPLDWSEPGTPNDWLRHAIGDLAYARAPVPLGGLLETRCFHAQQAAEKSIKAMLVFLGLPVPKAHNLKVLFELLSRSVTTPDALWRAAALTDYAVNFRYPGVEEPA